MAIADFTEMEALFAWLPIETLVHENQEVYYNALQTANNMGESTVFVEFMLEMIRDALREVETQMYWQAHLELHPDKHKEFWRS